jgi:hypothetical protein
MEIALSDKKYVDLVLSNIKSNNCLIRLSKTNRESLKEMISYLTNLNKNNLIDEIQLSDLIALACANYIENEVELRIEKSISNKLIFFLEHI